MKTFGQRAALACVVVLLIGGIILRLFAMRQELWFDEIWSLKLVASIQAPLDVFTAIHHDNNHYFNTLFLFLLGPTRSAFVYHLPSFVTSSILLTFLSFRALRSGPIEGVVTALLLNSSTMLIVYGAEARGYAGMLLFGTLSFLCLLRAIRTGNHWFTVFYGISAIVAVLWHISFILPLIGMMCWSAWVFYKRGEHFPYRRLLCMHTLPLCFLLLLTYIDLQFLEIGGAPEHMMGEDAVHAVGMLLGLPRGSWIEWIIAVAILMITFLFLENVLRKRVGTSAFLSLQMYLLPFLLVLAIAPSMLHPRYFLMFLLLILLAIARRVSNLLQCGGQKKAQAILILSLLFAANLTGIARTIRYGNGSYSPALRAIAAETTGQTITIAGHQDFRNSVLLEYYFPRILGSKPYRYVKADESSSEYPEWLLMEKANTLVVPQQRIQYRSQDYALLDSFPQRGSYWAVYQKETGH